MLLTIRDVLPIAAIIFGFQWLVIRRPLPNLKHTLIGFVYVLLGLSLFLVGLERALFPLGKLMAQQLTDPSFINDTLTAGSDLFRWYDYKWVYVFAAAIGFATTIAEPSLIAVAIKAEQVSVGAVNAWGLRVAVGLGVALAPDPPLSSAVSCGSVEASGSADSSPAVSDGSGDSEASGLVEASALGSAVSDASADGSADSAGCSIDGLGLERSPSNRPRAPAVTMPDPVARAATTSTRAMACARAATGNPALVVTRQALRSETRNALGERRRRARPASRTGDGAGSAATACITRSANPGVGAPVVPAASCSSSRAIGVSAATSSACRPEAPSSSAGVNGRG